MRVISRTKKRISSIEIVDYKGIPVYDGDVEEEAGIPEKVKKIAEKIRAADGVYISTPEYNYGFSAALKNIIDWLSRCKPAPLEGKPVTIVSTSAGPSGGFALSMTCTKF